MPASRPRLYHLYYVLAAFDVATVSVTLALIIWITGKYERSVAVNDFWAGRLAECFALSDLAAKVNAPGNDIFEADVVTPGRLLAEIESKKLRLAEARAAYDDRSAALRTALSGRADEPAAPELLAILDDSDRQIAAMTAEARAIFDHFSAGDRDAAGEPMARMDRHYAALTQNMTRLGEAVIAIQSVTLDEQVAAAQTLRYFEFGVAGLIVVMVTAVAIYGHTLARQSKAEARRTEERLERLVAERSRELEVSNEQLRLAERLASIGTLAAGLGHDMSNVLFPVRCRLDTLDAAELDDDLKAELASMRQSVDYLQQLSDGLRLLALDPDDATATAGVTDIAVWWREVGPLFRTALPRGATLDTRISESLPPVAIASHALTQAVFNLVVNAGEALAAGGSVRLECDADASFVHMVVRDDGPGMMPEVRRRALDPFFTTKTRSLSTGLGLALVHGAVQTAGGRVEIESAPGEGTAVHLLLPVAPTDDAAPARRGVAVVTLTDGRAAGLASTLLDAAGYDVRSGDDCADPIALWVTDAGTATETPARAALDGTGRLVAVEAGGDLVALRRILRDVLGTGGGEPV